MAKRAMDLAIAILGLLVCAPVLALIAALIKLDSRGPALYRGLRVGRHGRPFYVHKLRTMEVGADRRGPALTAAGDPRVTRVGAVLRQTKLDELPQLINVVKGEMSLVGPRPEHPDYVRLYTPEQRRVLVLRPGITSQASIAYSDEARLLAAARPDDTYIRSIMPAKLAMELAYLNRGPSVGNDLAILLRTLARLFKRATHRPVSPSSRS